MARIFGRTKRTEDGARRTRETWFGHVSRLFRGHRITEETWEELEEALVSADVGIIAATAMLQRVRESLQSVNDVPPPDCILELVKGEMLAVLGDSDSDVHVLMEDKESRPNPMVVLVTGVNGSGKTTSIAKLTRLFQEAGDRVLLGAADTFRAGAIDQLLVWGDRLGVEVVAHQPGGDPAAVAFDAVQAGKARGAQVVIIDTAGRLHTKHNLMEELRKIHRVIERLDSTAPHLTLLVMDATTGQNGVAQARAFTDAVSCDGVFLAKLDGTAKGGVVFAIRQELGLPVLFIGTGETAEDSAPFDASQFIEALFTAPVVDAQI